MSTQAGLCLYIKKGTCYSDCVVAHWHLEEVKPVFECICAQGCGERAGCAGEHEAGDGNGHETVRKGHP